jgi:hypothetical protein
MVCEKHLELLIEYRDGRALKEPVHVNKLGEGTFRLLYSPGLVQGIAAGDTFTLVGSDGAFKVTNRSGNLAVQIFSDASVAQYAAELAAQFARIDGVLDGEVDRGLVFTVPVSVGFPAIEAVVNAWVAKHPGWEWFYGNVYDPTDGTTLLGWWTGV